jgi:hypothetical protein
LFPSDTRVLRTLHVYTGADGVSHIEEGRLEGVSLPFLKTGKTMTETFLGPAPKVALVHGPADETIPVRAGIERVMFLTLAGSSTIVLPNKEEATATPGTLTIFDDKASTTGHGGRTGPCGYTAISMPIPDSAPSIPLQK